MTDTSPTRTLVVVVLVCVVLTGCSSIQSSSNSSKPNTTTNADTPTNGQTATPIVSTTTNGPSPGQLIVSEPSEVPENATVTNYTDPRVPSSDLLQSGFVEASEDDSSWSTELTGEQRNQLLDGFSDVPRYEGNKEGYYIQYDGTTYRINILTYD